MRILRRGGSIFVFSVGLLLGPICVLLLELRLGETRAVLCEAPFLLVTIVLAAQWVPRKLGLRMNIGPLAAMGRRRARSTAAGRLRRRRLPAWNHAGAHCRARKSLAPRVTKVSARVAVRACLMRCDFPHLPGPRDRSFGASTGSVHAAMENRRWSVGQGESN